MTLAICTYATKSYLHAWPLCLRGIAAAAAHHREAHFVFATDDSPESREAEELARRELPEGWKITTLRLPLGDDTSQSYKEAAQMRIAALQGAAFAFAKSKVRADLCWSVESDTIPTAESLRVLEWTLAMPTADGTPYYDVAAATYPNGLFLGGFGTPQNPIAEDFLPAERKLSSRLKLCLEQCEARLKEAKSPETAQKEGKRLGRLRDRVKKSPPEGNVWEVTAKHGWRRRGWMEFAYPGIGRGAIVPSDWCGLGCTLMSKRALALADFNGYDGRGTQDLFLCWKRWYPAGLRISCVPHVACDHVKRRDGKIEHMMAGHATEGEFRGHLRVETRVLSAAPGVSNLTTP